MTSQPAAASVFLTGVTGFLGKVVLEELVRRRAELGIENVLVLVRPAKDTGAEKRFHREVAVSPCFSRLEADWLRCVQVVPGDLVQDRCGIGDDTYPLICEEVTHIINCAACVSFDAGLIAATHANVTSARNLIALAKACPRLRGMTTTSTAYVAPHSETAITATVVPLPADAEQLYRGIIQRDIDETSLLRRTHHPNTYTLTKCLAEHMYLRHADTLPLTIVRPSIIACSWRYPVPGWIDSKAAVAGFVALVGSGYLRVVDGRADTILDVVPVDVVAGDLLEHARLSRADPPTYGHSKAAPESGVKRYPIFHSVAGIHKSVSVGLIASTSVAFFREVQQTKSGCSPTPTQTRPPRPGGSITTRTPQVTYLGSRNLHFHIRDMLDQRLPLALARVCLSLGGQDQLARKARSLSRVIKKINQVFPFYTHHTFDFETARTSGSCTEEEEIEHAFTFNREEYLNVLCRGVQEHLLRM